MIHGSWMDVVLRCEMRDVRCKMEAALKEFIFASTTLFLTGFKAKEAECQVPV